MHWLVILKFSNVTSLLLVLFRRFQESSVLAPVARLDPGETRAFILILGTMAERAGDSMCRWRLGLFDGAGGRLDQKEMNP